MLDGNTGAPFGADDEVDLIDKSAKYEYRISDLQLFRTYTVDQRIEKEGMPPRLFLKYNGQLLQNTYPEAAFKLVRRASVRAVVAA